MGWHDGFKYQSTEQLWSTARSTSRQGKTGPATGFTNPLSAEAKSDTIRPDEERHAKFALVLAAVRGRAPKAWATTGTGTRSSSGASQARSSAYTLPARRTTRRRRRSCANASPSRGPWAWSGRGHLRALAPLMHESGGRIRAVQVSCRVRFKKAALQRLFARRSPEQLRRVIRELVLARFAGDATLAPMAWAFYFHLRHEDWEALLIVTISARV